MLKCLNFGFFSCVLYCKKRCFLILVLLRTFKSEQNVDLFAFISLLSNILHNIRKDTNCYVLPLFSNLLNLFLTVLNIPLLEKYPLSEFFWSVFSSIRTEYRETRREYSVQIWENTNPKNYEYRQFSRSVLCVVYSFFLFLFFCFFLSVTHFLFFVTKTMISYFFTFFPEFVLELKEQWICILCIICPWSLFLLHADLYKSALPTYSFQNLVLRLSVFCIFGRLCFELGDIFKDLKHLPN